MTTLILASGSHPTHGAAVASSAFTIVVWALLTVIAHQRASARWVSYVMMVVLGALIVGSAGKLGDALRELTSFVDQAMGYVVTWLS